MEKNCTEVSKYQDQYGMYVNNIEGKWYFLTLEYQKK